MIPLTTVNDYMDWSAGGRGPLRWRALSLARRVALQWRLSPAWWQFEHLTSSSLHCDIFNFALAETFTTFVRIGIDCQEQLMIGGDRVG